MIIFTQRKRRRDLLFVPHENDAPAHAKVADLRKNRVFLQVDGGQNCCDDPKSPHHAKKDPGRERREGAEGKWMVFCLIFGTVPCKLALMVF